jgi:hypothetical protein
LYDPSNVRGWDEDRGGGTTVYARLTFLDRNGNLASPFSSWNANLGLDPNVCGTTQTPDPGTLHLHTLRTCSTWCAGTASLTVHVSLPSLTYPIASQRNASAIFAYPNFYRGNPRTALLVSSHPGSQDRCDCLSPVPSERGGRKEHEIFIQSLKPRIWIPKLRTRGTSPRPLRKTKSLVVGISQGAKRESPCRLPIVERPVGVERRV